MIKWLNNIFKYKYEVWIYEKRVTKYYGLCGWDIIRKEEIVTINDGLVGRYERLFDILKCDKLEANGFKLIKIETKYL